MKRLNESIMEKKELLVGTACTPSAVRFNLVARIESCVWLQRLASVYSALLEEKISPRRTLRLLHAQAALFCAVAPASMPLGLRTVLLAWAGVAVWQCRMR